MAGDGTRAFLFRADDETVFETVQLPSERGSIATTVCISSQAGCAMGCTFCATGTLGLTRNLSVGGDRGPVPACAARELGERRRRTAWFSWGWASRWRTPPTCTTRSRRWSDPGRGGFGSRHITVSTVGLPAGIAELTRWPWQSRPGDLAARGKRRYPRHPGAAGQARRPCDANVGQHRLPAGDAAAGIVRVHDAPRCQRPCRPRRAIWRGSSTGRRAT